MIMKIDHVVITTAKLEECLHFYQTLGFVIRDGEGRYEAFAGDFKINIHIKDQELQPHAGHVQTGSLDLCMEIEEPLEHLKEKLELQGIVIELGIVERTGVNGSMKSIYLRDPDKNLIELCSYDGTRPSVER